MMRPHGPGTLPWLRASLVLLLVGSSLACLQAQIIVEGQPLEKLGAGRYLSVRLVGNGQQRQVEVDYGQKDRWNPAIGNRLTDAVGTPLTFPTPVSLFNYMDQQGWEVVSGQSLGNRDASYLLQRKAGK